MCVSFSCVLDLRYTLLARFVFMTGTQTECYAAQAEREKRMQMAVSDTEGISIHLHAVLQKLLSGELIY